MRSGLLLSGVALVAAILVGMHQRLANAVRLFEGSIHGAESVSVDPTSGTLLLLDKHGYLHRADPSDTPPGYTLEGAPPAYVGPGRPLASHMDAAGDLVICDTLKGLTMLDREGRLSVLTNRVGLDSPLQPGTPLRYVNDLDIASDGTVYFSDSSAIQPIFNPAVGHWDTLTAYMLDLLTGSPSGRLVRFRPRDRSTHVLATGVYYANGVALAADESFVLVVETSGMRILQHHLQGPKAGSTEVFIDSLPGFPDGLTRADDGAFWVAILVPPLRALPLLKHRVFRLLMAWLPRSLKPRLGRWGLVIKLSPEGRVVDCLVDEAGARVAGISAVTQHGQRLFFGNLQGSYVSYVDV